jgi:Mg2+ and Co2+ transporter CorA
MAIRGQCRGGAIVLCAKLIDCAVDMFADLLRTIQPASQAVNDLLCQMTDKEAQEVIACAPDFFAGRPLQQVGA